MIYQFLEICDSEKLGEELPLVFFYHGWTGCKERVLTQGYEIAKKGFRVILPRCFISWRSSRGRCKRACS